MNAPRVSGRPVPRVGAASAAGQPCRHERRVLARNVTAWIRGGHLHGGDPDAPVLAYDAILYCASPTCEHVFHAERAGTRDNARKRARPAGRGA